MKLQLSVALPDRERIKASPHLASNLEVVKRAAMQAALEASGGNVSRAADILGINRRTFQRNLTWNWREDGKVVNGFTDPSARRKYDDGASEAAWRSETLTSCTPSSERSSRESPG